MNSDLITQEITIDIDNEFYEKIKMKQNDTARTLIVNIVKNGQQVNLSGDTVTCSYLRSDGKDGYVAAGTSSILSKGIIYLDITNIMLAIYGNIELELKIINSKNVITTCVFCIEVTRSIRNDTAIESSNEYTALTIAEAKAQEQINIMEQWDKDLKAVYPNLELKYASTLSSLNEKIKKVIVNVRDFGAKIDGETDDSTAVQNAINSVELTGGIIQIPEGICIIGTTLIIPSNVSIEGKGKRITILKKKNSFNDYMFKTKNFDTLTGTNNYDNAITGFSIRDITILGNYMKEVNGDYSEYVNKTGGGIKIYGRLFSINCEILNVAGVGLWIECNGNELLSSQKHNSKDYDVSVEIRDCKEECFILRGLSDGRINKLWCRGGGSRISSEQNNSPPPSSNYTGYNYTDNIVLEAGAEINMIHSWGCLTGKGLRTIGDSRINANIIICESCRYGGALIDTSCYGNISTLDVHGCGGGGTYGQSNGTIPDLEIKSTRPFNISNLHLENVGTSSTGQTSFLLSGNFVNVANMHINKYLRTGNGIEVTGNYNNIRGIIQNASDGIALKKISTNVFRYNNIDLQIINCLTAFNNIGQGRYEYIKIIGDLKIGQSVFNGDSKDNNNNSNWDILFNVNGVYKTSEFTGMVAFDSSKTDEQTIIIPHTLIYAPSTKNIQTSIYDSPTGYIKQVQYMYVDTVSDTDIKVKIKMLEPQGVNTTPYICVYAKI